MSIIKHLDPSWSKAFLRRTRFDDANFQGDILAVISKLTTAYEKQFSLMDVHYSDDIYCAAYGASTAANYALPIVGQVHASFPRT